MKFSFKKKDDDFFVLLEEKDQNIKDSLSDGKTVSHNALTPDEVISGFGNENKTNISQTGALDSLKKRIVSAAANKEKGKIISENQDNVSLEQHSDNSAENDLINTTETQDISKKALTPTETETQKASGADEVRSNRAADKKSSLLDKCSAYIIDEDGNEADLNAKPLYKLQSVAEILKTDSEKALERLSEKYDVSFDDLGRKSDNYSDDKPARTQEPTPRHAKSLKNSVPETETESNNRQPEIFEDKISLKNVQSNVKSIISDIDIPSAPTDSAGTPKINDTATITFTPVIDSSDGKSHLSVSSKTRPIDLTGELAKLPEISEDSDEVQLEKNEFEDYTPKEEFDSSKNAGKFIRKFSINKRNSFVITFFSIFLTVILSSVKLPFMSEFILSHTRIVMTVCAALTAVIVLINSKMFVSLKNIFRRRCVPDVSMSLASLTVMTYAVFGIFSGIIITDILILLAVMLSFRSLACFYKSSFMLSNIRQISGSHQKNAVKLIDDNAITFAMSKNAIDGDVLIAAPQKTEQVSDFIKYSTFGIFLGGKLPIITVTSVILSIILGFTCASYFDGAVYGFYAAAAIQCFTALPAAFLIDIFPQYRAAKKLNRKGGMIAGKTGAEYLEMANAVVIDSADLFPPGAITLHQMKVLSENNLEDTIVRAASLTETLNSALAPIFKKIAGTGNITTLPDSDTVKYEDRMGISGWVDNRLLFIGNRTLMEAHGIEVPPVEVDRRILRKGYFPVYVATKDKACALLIVQYTADKTVASELRKLTSSGVTLLINNCDPNLIEEMICDYFGLYTDSVKVMSAAGCHMYKNAVSPIKAISAPAVFRGNPITLVSILNIAAKIKKSNILLTAMYIISAVLGAVIFAYTSLSGSGEMVSETLLLLYGLISTVLTYFIYIFVRP